MNEIQEKKVRAVLIRNASTLAGNAGKDGVAGEISSAACVRIITRNKCELLARKRECLMVTKLPSVL